MRYYVERDDPFKPEKLVPETEEAEHHRRFHYPAVELSDELVERFARAQEEWEAVVALIDEAEERSD